MAQAGPSSSAILSQAIAEIHLGRFDEAESALQQALAQFPDNADVIANYAVLAVLSGKPNNEYIQYECTDIFTRPLLTCYIGGWSSLIHSILTSKDLPRRAICLTRRQLSSQQRFRHNRHSVMEFRSENK